MSVGSSPSEPAGQAPIDPREYRRIIGTFATGITVITMPTADGAWGMTANSLTSLSLDPLLLIVCVDNGTRTLQHMRDSKVWAVNILAADQEQVSRTFATKDFETERTMVNTPYHLGPAGAPLIDGCVTHIECRTWATYEGGDHTIFVGQVLSATVADQAAEPIVFFKGRYRQLAGE